MQNDPNPWMHQYYPLMGGVTRFAFRNVSAQSYWVPGVMSKDNYTPDVRASRPCQETKRKLMRQCDCTVLSQSH